MASTDNKEKLNTTISNLGLSLALSNYETEKAQHQIVECGADVVTMAEHLKVVNSRDIALSKIKF